MSIAVAAPPNLNAYLELDPEHPDDMRIVGTRLSVRHLSARYQAGERPEDFHENWPYVPLAVFYAVVAYYLENKDRIDREIDEDEAKGMELARSHAEDPALRLRS